MEGGEGGMVEGEREKPWIRVWVKVDFVEQHVFGF